MSVTIKNLPSVIVFSALQLGICHAFVVDSKGYVTNLDGTNPIHSLTHYMGEMTRHVEEMLTDSEVSRSDKESRLNQMKIWANELKDLAIRTEEEECSCGRCGSPNSLEEEEDLVIEAILGSLKGLIGDLKTHLKEEGSSNILEQAFGKNSPEKRFNMKEFAERMNGTARDQSSTSERITKEFLDNLLSKMK
jgi:hypothetical protein